MIYLMRHGQDDETYVGGWSNVPLIPEGIKEVRDSAEWIRENLKINKIICSDVLRAVETAKIVSEYLGVPYTPSENLREQNKGLLNGVEKEIAYTKYPGYKDGEVTTETVFPEGESLRNLYERVKIYLQKILSMDDGTLLITHRGYINMIYFLLRNQELDMDKKQFGVTTASIHELDKKNKLIKKVR